MESSETGTIDVRIKAIEPKELTLIWDGDKFTKVLIDEIEIPFACEIEMKNEIITMLHGPLEMIMGLGRGPTYLQGECEITLTIKPRSLVVKKKGAER